MMNQPDLPQIPEKLYFSIGEVATLCALKPHVLRYWEQEFQQLNPTKRRGNRRYYQRKDVIMIRRIKDLLYNQGYTIEGARHQLIVERRENENHPMKEVMQTTVRELENVLNDLQD